MYPIECSVPSRRRYYRTSHLVRHCLRDLLLRNNRLGYQRNALGVVSASPVDKMLHGTLQAEVKGAAMLQTETGAPGLSFATFYAHMKHKTALSNFAGLKYE